MFLSIDDESLPDMVRLADGTNELRLYAGHAAWVPGQLQTEINAGGWQLLPGSPELVFHADPGGLWAELEGRGGERRQRRCRAARLTRARRELKR